VIRRGPILRAVPIRPLIFQRMKGLKASGAEEEKGLLRDCRGWHKRSPGPCADSVASQMAGRRELIEAINDRDDERTGMPRCFASASSRGAFRRGTSRR